MVKLTGQSALVIVHLSPHLANTQQRFLLKAVDPTSSTNFVLHLVVTHATVVQTEYYEAKKLKIEFI